MIVNEFRWHKLTFKWTRDSSYLDIFSAKMSVVGPVKGSISDGWAFLSLRVKQNQIGKWNQDAFVGFDHWSVSQGHKYLIDGLRVPDGVWGG